MACVKSEQHIIEKMIRLYCLKKHRQKTCVPIARHFWIMLWAAWSDVLFRIQNHSAAIVRSTATNRKCENACRR